MLAVLRIAGREARERRRLAGIRAREIGADLRPRPAAVARREDDVQAEIQRVPIDAIPHERIRAIEAIRLTVVRRRDVARLSRALVVHGRLAAVDQPRVMRVGRDVAVFFRADRMEFAERDRAVVAAARHLGAAALLLAAEDAVRKPIVRDDVVELRRRLVVPRTPRRAAVDRDGRALIDAERDRLRIVRIDPHGVIVVAAGRAFDAGPRRAAVARAISRRVCGVDLVRVVRIGGDAGEIFRAPAHALFLVRLPPRRARVVGAVHAAAVRFLDERVDARRLRGRHRDPDATRERRQAVRELRPRRAAVGRLEETAAIVEFVDLREIPRTVARCPKRRIDDVRVRGIDRDRDSPDVAALVAEHPRERRAAVERAIESAFGVRAERVPDGRDEKTLRIVRVDCDRLDLLRVAKSLVQPRRARIARHVNAVARREIRTAQTLAAADVDDVRIGRRDGERPDRPRILRVEHRRPRARAVDRFPDAAVVRRHVERAGFSGNARDRDGPPAAERPDVPPVQRGDGR